MPTAARASARGLASCVGAGRAGGTLLDRARGSLVAERGSLIAPSVRVGVSSGVRLLMRVPPGVLRLRMRVRGVPRGEGEVGVTVPLPTPLVARSLAESCASTCVQHEHTAQSTTESRVQSRAAKQPSQGWSRNAVPCSRVQPVQPRAAWSEYVACLGLELLAIVHPLLVVDDA
jgi:hypothetical protein